MSEKIDEVRLREETLNHLKDVMREAVREGVSDLVTEETIAAFWSGGLTMLQQQAAEHAGRFVLGGLWGLFRKAALFLFLGGAVYALGGAVYALGGWSALAALFKAVFSSGGTT